MVALTLAAACSSGVDAATGARSDELKVAVPSLGDVLDPRDNSGPGSAGVLIALEPLMRYQTDGSLAPALATSVSTPNPTTYVYTIRHGVTFWDGTALTPQDVKFSLQLHAAKNAQSNNASLFASVSSVRVTAADEVTIGLSEPDPQFSYNVAQIGIVSEGFYKKNGDKVGTPGALNMGTGPYRFTGFTPSKEIGYTAYTGYWGKKPAFKKLTVGVISDDAARLNALRSGEYDGIFNLPIPQVETVRKLNGTTLGHTPDLSVYKFNFNVKTKPWNDVHLRRAFALAIDRAGLVTGPLGGKAVLAPTVEPEPVMAKLAGATATKAAYDAMAKAYSFDPVAAKAELAQSTVPSGLKTQLLVTASDPNLALIAQTAAQSLAKIGIRVEVKQVDDATYYNAVYFKHTTQGVSLDLFSGSSPDASNLPLSILSGENSLTRGGSGINISDYVNSDVDRLLTKSQRQGVDSPARGRSLLQAVARAQQDVPYVPIAFPELYNVARSGLKVGGFDAFWWLTDWPDEMAGS